MNDSDTIFDQAMGLHESGSLIEAIKLYRHLFQEHHTNPRLNFMLGLAYVQDNQCELGIQHLSSALAFYPNDIGVLTNLGIAYRKLGKAKEALASFDHALSINPEVAAIYINRGNTLRELNDLEGARTNYLSALSLENNNLDAMVNLGAVLNSLDRPTQALEVLHKAIRLNLSDAETYVHIGNALSRLGRLNEALNNYNYAVMVQPDYAEAYRHRGILLQVLKRLNEALADYNKAIAVNPALAQTYTNRGNLFCELKRLNEALIDHNKAIELKPDLAEAYSNRGIVLLELKRPHQAVADHSKAIALKPDYAGGYSNRGVALLELHRPDEAIIDFRRALQMAPDTKLLPGTTFHTEMILSDWKNFENNLDVLTIATENSIEALTPFELQSVIDSPKLQKKCAETHVASQYPNQMSSSRTIKNRTHKKIRIGYFSSDFYNHPVAHLLATLFEIHDRRNFDVLAFSLLERAPDEWRNRIINGVDDFIDVSAKSDTEIANLSRSLEIDIAVDLNGHTKHARTGIFAHQAAPIQTSYLGFLGTIGAPYFDYLFADPILVPENARDFYTEKIAYLRHYQCNSDTLKTSTKAFKRSEFGLPEGAFVFCSPNNNYKITPLVFDSWMRILNGVPNSVLWIYVDNTTAMSNIQVEATSRGVDQRRLIFANKIPLEEHLSRHKLADLFLDTFPYNAGATASNALRVGLPVITRTGESFSSRYGASLLNTLGLPELVAASVEEYEFLAIDLATNANKLTSIREKLLGNLEDSALYNAKRFARSIESLFIEMYQRFQQGLPADHIIASH